MTRVRIGQHATQEDLKDDWTMTHELDHMAFPSLPDDQHWMEEGLATYVEPIARVETGELKPQQIWHDMVRDMHKGEPAEGDQGLDHTHTWGRTYWGGAMFCLVADVEIRRQTGNKKVCRMRCGRLWRREERSITSGRSTRRSRLATRRRERMCSPNSMRSGRMRR